MHPTSPLIASNVTSIPEVAGDAAVLVNPLSVQDMTQALTDILLHDDIAKDLVNRGRQRLKMFCQDSIIDDLIALYTKAQGR